MDTTDITDTSWAIKYRPRNLEDIVLPNTSNNLRVQLEKFYNNGFVNGNLLCYGSAGRGKTALNDVLIHKIIEESRDICILERKSEDVDELKKWLQYAKGSSSQKIVIIEEIDKLSPQAQTLLKDGLMEKYQKNTAFLATTNYPDKLDPALLSRFNTQINFDEPLLLNELFMRLKHILDSESVSYQDNQLKTYIETHPRKGLREMIHDIESASVTGTFAPDFNTEQVHHEISAIITSSSIEKEITRLTTKYNKSVLSKDEMASELDISTKTLDRHIKDSSNIPSHKILGTNKIIFSIRTVAEFLCSD